MLNKFRLLSLMACCAAACEKDNPAPGEKVAILTIINPYIAGTWAFVTDNEGHVLDSQPIKYDTLFLSTHTPVPDSVNLTIFNNTDSYQSVLFTYLGIPKNTVITVAPPEYGPTDPVPEIGSASLTITGFGSNPFESMINFSDGLNLLYEEPTGSVTKQFTLYSGDSNMLVSGYDGITPVYAWVNGIHNGDVISKTSGSFSPFPKTILLDFQDIPTHSNVSASIGGIIANKAPFGYYTLDFFNNQSTSVPTLGYLDGFDSYSTRVSYAGSPSMEYHKNGTINNLIKFENLHLSVSDQTSGNYPVGVSGNYNYKIVNWESNDEKMLWYICSGYQSTAPKLNGIPSDLVEKFGPDTGQMQYRGIDVYLTLDDFSYSNHYRNLYHPMKPKTGECFKSSIY